MSIARMIALGNERQQQGQTRTRATSARSEATKKTIDSAMEKVSAFIPSEVIGIYVGFGILSPEREPDKWWIFGICLALIPLVFGLNYLLQKKRADPPQNPDFPLQAE
ncbi:MAG TPA: hypothetical protein VMT72_05515, partial [Pseudolabrys sp.]|nr:hypothetical protein [Pseudolabrys sp.]